MARQTGRSHPGWLAHALTTLPSAPTTPSRRPTKVEAAIRRNVGQCVVFTSISAAIATMLYQSLTRLKNPSHAQLVRWPGADGGWEISGFLGVIVTIVLGFFIATQIGDNPTGRRARARQAQLLAIEFLSWLICFGAAILTWLALPAAWSSDGGLLLSTLTVSVAALSASLAALSKPSEERRRYTRKINRKRSKALRRALREQRRALLASGIAVPSKRSERLAVASAPFMLGALVGGVSGVWFWGPAANEGEFVSCGRLISFWTIVGVALVGPAVRFFASLRVARIRDAKLGVAARWIDEAHMIFLAFAAWLLMLSVRPEAAWVALALASVSWILALFYLRTGVEGLLAYGRLQHSLVALRRR